MKLETARDYRYTGAWLNYFQREYERLRLAPLGHDHPLQREGELGELLSQIEDFQKQMEDFKKRDFNRPPAQAGGMDETLEVS